MFRAVLKAVFVFLFMAFLAAQASTGFMRELFAGSVYPRALRAFDWVLETVFTGPLGPTGGAIALLVLGAFCAVLIIRREIKENSPVEVAGSANVRGSGDDSAAKVRSPRRLKLKNAAGRAWISGICHSDGMSYKRGARTKFYDHDWEPATYEIPAHPDDVHAAFRRHWAGYALERSEFPEALAVFDPKAFAKEKDFFMAGPFAAAKGKLVDILSRFDLGEGGLIPLPIYKADLETPHPGEFYFINFGARKGTLLAEESVNVRKLGVVNRTTGLQHWVVNSWRDDRDVILTTDALSGPDLWFEDRVHSEVFISDRLAQALIEAGMKDLFSLKECRVVEVRT